MQVGLEDRLMLLALVGVLLAHANDHAQSFGIEAVGLGFRIDVADIVGDRFFLLLEALDALDKGFEVVLGNAGSGHALRLLGGRPSGQPQPLSERMAAASRHAGPHPQNVGLMLPSPLKAGLLVGARLALVFRLPFLVWHSVDELPALV